MLKEHYDVIVVGAGHAGCEAALASARMGMKTMLATMDLDRVAQMSCNPAIGGLGKGHLVREIDALGGQMGKAIDATGIHFKMLGTSRGPAVHGPRAQADKKLYQYYMKSVVEETENLLLRQDRIEALLIDKDKITGLRCLTGNEYYAKAVILTTGTFLNGTIHMGLSHYSGGRASEPGPGGCSNSLQKLGFETARLKTGTPPRVHSRSIDYSACEPQKSDEVPRPFSFSNKTIAQPQITCYITYTNPKTHKVIAANLDQSPIYSGKIDGVGPRYCPSIEDKIVKFPDRERHQIFLEPEGLETQEVYCNGISSSLPSNVQKDYVRTIKGLEKAEIMRFGYAVEYDFVPPTQIYPTMETKIIEGLYLAGQINGTTGYEEAAAQGIMAGINAALKLKNEEPVILTRDQAYIGVLIDDLVTRGTNEPYRMFTSRAEYRLLLRQDNADRRLMPIGKKIGLVPDSLYQPLLKKEEKVEELKKILWSNKNNNNPLARILRRPDTRWGDICKLKEDLEVFNEYPQVVEQVEIEIKYEGYIERQEIQIRKFQRMEKTHIPKQLDYKSIDALKIEAREKLARHNPLSIGQASRIPGITPADISILIVHVESLQKKLGS